MSDQDQVLKASGKFYAALNSMVKGDAGPMADAWSHAADVTAMHPIGGRQVGWDEVIGSFRQVAELSSGGSVRVMDQLIRVVGDVAYELGVEQGNVKLAGTDVSIDHRVTNTYRKEGGAWKLVHHHTDTSPAMMKVLENL